MSKRPSALAIVAGAFAAAVAPDDLELEVAAVSFGEVFEPEVRAAQSGSFFRSPLDALVLGIECAKLEADCAARAINEARLAEAREIFDRALARSLGATGVEVAGVAASLDVKSGGENVD